MSKLNSELDEELKRRIEEVFFNEPKKPVKLVKRAELSEQEQQEYKERETDREGQVEYYKLRGRWSWFLFFFMLSMLLFQYGLTLAIGRGWLDFISYPLYLGIVIGENFLQIVAMVTIAVKFLFSPAPRLNKKND